MAVYVSDVRFGHNQDSFLHVTSIIVDGGHLEDVGREGCRYTGAHPALVQKSVTACKEGKQ